MACTFKCMYNNIHVFIGQPVVSFLYKHSSTPNISSVQYNPMSDSTTPAPPSGPCPRAPVSHMHCIVCI